MGKTRDIGSAIVAALGGFVTALAFLGLYAAVSLPVMDVARQLI